MQNGPESWLKLTRAKYIQNEREDEETSGRAGRDSMCGINLGYCFVYQPNEPQCGDTWAEVSTTIKYYL